MTVLWGFVFIPAEKIKEERGFYVVDICLFIFIYFNTGKLKKNLILIIECKNSRKI